MNGPISTGGAAAGAPGAGDIEAVVAGAGLTGGGASGSVTLTVGAGTGIVVNADDVAIDPTVVALAATTMTAGAGLTGGGSLAANRTLAVGAGTGIIVNADDVAIDPTVVALAATQTIAGAGLTGGGTHAADRTLTVGAGTGITVNADDVAVNQATAFAWTAAHGWVVTDAVTNDHTDILTLDHQTSGTAAGSFGSALLFRGEDASGNSDTMGRVGFAWSTATSGSEASFFGIYQRVGGAALAAVATPTWKFDVFGTITNTSSVSGVALTTTVSDMPVTLQGRRNAGSSTADVISRSTNTRTAGNLHEFNNNGTIKASIAFDGTPRLIAANEQTTVGAAGAGSALPATPTKYMKVRGSDDVLYVTPLYAAA